MTIQFEHPSYGACHRCGKEGALNLCGHCTRYVCEACARVPVDIDLLTRERRTWSRVVCQDRATEWVLTGDQSIEVRTMDEVARLPGGFHAIAR